MQNQDIMTDKVNATGASNSTLNNTEISDSTQDSYLWTYHDIIKGITISTFAIVIIIGNFICLLALKRTRIRQPTKVLMYSLNAADLCVGIFLVFPTAVSSYINDWIFGYLGCFITVIIGGAPYYTSNWTLLALAVERYIAVTQPLKYRATFTLSRARLTVALIWITSHGYEILVSGLNNFEVYFDPPTDTCWSLPHGGGDLSIKTSVVILIFGPFIAFTILYLHIFYIIRQQNALRREMTYVVGERQYKGVSAQDMKMAKTFMIITFAFFLTAFPVTVNLIVEVATAQRSNQWVYFFTFITTISNAWLNSLIYYVRNASFRHCVVEMFKCTSQSKTRRATSFNTISGSRIN